MLPLPLPSAYHSQRCRGSPALALRDSVRFEETADGMKGLRLTVDTNHGRKGEHLKSYERARIR